MADFRLHRLPGFQPLQIWRGAQDLGAELTMGVPNAHRCPLPGQEAGKRLETDARNGMIEA
jgi:hypothetical protein